MPTGSAARIFGGPPGIGQGDDDVLWRELADGNDQLYGGAGVDTVDYSNAADTFVGCELI